MSRRGVVAAGHEVTAAVAAEILEAGGNAFDAAVAAHFAACVAEPVLCSLGGGGFLLAHEGEGRTRVYDFFAHTPRTKRPAAEMDFRPILADFGTTQQEFHIGLGAVATPGTVAGLFAVHRDLGSVPMPVLLEPAIELARRGLAVNRLQAFAFDVVKPIYRASAAARQIFSSPGDPDRLVAEGDLLRQPELADVLEGLGRHGEGWFYRGELAQAIAALCAPGGHLRLEDLRSYSVLRREPLQFRYRRATIYTNPPPSSGGILIAFALHLLDALDLTALGQDSAAHLGALVEVMAGTNAARVAAQVAGEQPLRAEALLEPSLLDRYRREILGRARSYRGTTHLNVMDEQGNFASMTMSNGEGCGTMVPDTGIMLNNMLGEEDLNPRGFHRWFEDQRLTSMMSPTLVSADHGAWWALGSGGSNRIRTAILQVLVRILDFDAALEEAVTAPRVHFENGHLDVEPGFPAQALAPLLRDHPDHRLWAEPNLFFGGVHVTGAERDGFSGCGDPRRNGVVRVVG